MTKPEILAKITFGEEMDDMRFSYGPYRVSGFVRVWTMYELNFEDRYLILKRAGWLCTLRYWWHRIADELQIFPPHNDNRRI